MKSPIRYHESSQNAQSNGDFDIPRAVDSLNGVLGRVEGQGLAGKEGHGAHQVSVVRFTQDDPSDPHNWGMLL